MKHWIRSGLAGSPRTNSSRWRSPGTNSHPGGEMFLHDGSDWAVIGWLRGSQKHPKTSKNISDPANIWLCYQPKTYFHRGYFLCFLWHFAFGVRELFTVSVWDRGVGSVTASDSVSDFDKIAQFFFFSDRSKIQIIIIRGLTPSDSFRLWQNYTVFFVFRRIKDPVGTR